MKAVILAAGRGNRLNNETEKINKCMIHIGNKPIIQYSLDHAAEIPQITEIIIVVGHKRWDIMNHFNTEYKGKKIKYIIQSHQKGLVHAIERVETALNREDFFLMLGDEIITESRHIEMVEDFQIGDVFGLCGVIRRQRDELEKISRTYSMTLSKKWDICRLVEKPTYFPNIFQGTGHCIFKNKILNYIPETPVDLRRGREEKELPSLIQCAIDDGKVFRGFVIGKDYFNINSDNDIKEAKEI